MKPLCHTLQVGGINPFLSLPDPETAVDYKRGYVMRKACFDPNYKKTKLGKRSWKMFYLTLRDLVLYCHKVGRKQSKKYRKGPNLARTKEFGKKNFITRMILSPKIKQNPPSIIG